MPQRGVANLLAVLLALASFGARAQSCGVERWSVKTGTDADAGAVALNAPQSNTIVTLRSWPAPNPIPPNTRATPYETTVWVINATLTQYKLESDSDIHLVLQDASGLTMIAEIPSPGCVGSSSPLASGISNARAQFQAVYTPTTSFQTANVPVRITGVGMFDFLHGQTGVAPNGIELHPVIDIQFNPGTQNTVAASITTPAGNVTLASGASQAFAGSATDSSTSATLAYSWTFGDGGTATGASVSHAYTNTGASALTYTATLTATDNTGASGKATRTITVNPATDTQPPVVSVSESGTSGSVTFAASATDNVGVTRVEFDVDGALIGTDTAAPYTLAYDSTKLTNGAHSLVAKAYDAAGNVGTSGTATFSINNGTGGGGTTVQILGNPGFETGTASPWVTSSGVLDNSTSEAAHGGTWKAWLDGYGSSHTDTLYQQVTIDPTATAATLTFWLHIDTAETTTTTANDTLKVQLRNISGTVQATLATYSNLNAASGFVQKTFDLSAYKGQTLQVYLVGAENASNQTSFVVDDFALNITTSGSDTTPPTVSATESGTSGAITFNASATDNVGVTKVEFYVDGGLKGTDTASPYTMTLDSTTLANSSHSLVAKAYDAAGNVGTSATVSFPINNSSGTPTDLISNGGFESGATGWSGSSGVIAQNGTSEPAHSGTWDAWLDGYGSSHTDTLSQTVSIQASASTATLAFWLHVDTAETSTTSAYDTLTVQVRNSSGTVLGTLATYSNLDATSGYVQKTFDLTAYKGQTVQICLTGTEDASQQTSFVLDDVSLIAQ
jgi:hypothetical protein